MKILLIEDSPTDRLLFKWAASRLQLEFKISSTVAEAVEVVAKEVFDIVLADYHLSDGTGLELASKVGPETFFVIFSSSTSREAKRLARAADLVWIEKPDKIDELFEFLKRTRNYLKEVLK